VVRGSVWPARPGSATTGYHAGISDVIYARGANRLPQRDKGSGGLEADANG